MASRFWVGGTDTWNSTVGTKWATTSGGAGGASVPTSTDDAFIDAASGAVTVTKGTSALNCLSLNFTGFTGTFASAGTSTTLNGGNLTMATGMTYTATTGGFTFQGAGSYSVTSNGKALGKIIKAGTGTLSLVDALDVRAGSAGSKTMHLNAGTLNTNGFVLKCGDFYSANSNTRTLTTTTAGYIDIYGVAGGIPATVWETSIVTGLTITAGGKIVVDSPSIGSTFVGSVISSGAITLPALTVSSSGFVVLQISAPTFAGLDADMSASSASMAIWLSQDVTVAGNLTLKGYLSNPSDRLLLLSNSSGTQRILSCSGTVVADKVSVQDNNADGTASPFYATGKSVLESNTTDWIIADPSKPLMLLGVGQ